MYKPQLVFFIETKLDGKGMEKIKRLCGFFIGIEIGADGSKRDSCLAWKEGVQVALKQFFCHFIDVIVKSNDEEI